MDPTAYAIAATFWAVIATIVAAGFCADLRKTRIERDRARAEVAKMDGDGDGKVGGYWKR